jgi:hypothetical protein
MQQRMEFALKALKSESFRARCQEYGISTKAGYKWRERFLGQGLPHRLNRSYHFYLTGHDRQMPQSTIYLQSTESICSGLSLVTSSDICFPALRRSNATRRVPRQYSFGDARPSGT